MKVKNLKKQVKGMTLLTLIVIIIVMLILAGIVLNLTIGNNGVFKRAEKAKEESEKASVKEQAQMDITSWIIGQIEDGESIELNDATIKSILEKANQKNNLYYKELKDDRIITSSGYEVLYSELYDSTSYSLAGKYYAEDTDITIGDKTITIPGGATISKIPGEYDVNEGLVIYITNREIKSEEWNSPETIKETYDQFVWVLVQNPVLDLTPDNGTLLTKEDGDTIKAKVQEEINSERYPMAIKNGENYFGVLYQFTEENGTVKVEIYENWAPLSGSYEEPNIVRQRDEDIANLNQMNDILSTTYSSSTDFKNDLQTKFNAMVKV